MESNYSRRKLRRSNARKREEAVMIVKELIKKLLDYPLDAEVCYTNHLDKSTEVGSNMLVNSEIQLVEADMVNFARVEFTIRHPN